MFFKKNIYLFLERGEGREKEQEGNTDVREKHLLVVSCMYPLPRPPAGSKSATQACALTGNQTSNIFLFGTTPNQLSHTGQDCNIKFSKLLSLTPAPWEKISIIQIKENADSGVPKEQPRLGSQREVLAPRPWLQPWRPWPAQLFSSAAQNSQPQTGPGEGRRWRAC